MKTSNRSLYISTKILDSDDYIRGYGKNELVITGISAILGIVVSVIYYFFQKNMVTAVLLAFGIIVLTVFIFRRDMYNENLIDKIKIIRKSKQMQKRYYYKYLNSYGDAENEKGTITGNSQ